MSIVLPKHKHPILKKARKKSEKVHRAGGTEKKIHKKEDLSPNRFHNYVKCK